MAFDRFVKQENYKEIENRIYQGEDYPKLCFMCEKDVCCLEKEYTARKNRYIQNLSRILYKLPDLALDTISQFILNENYMSNVKVWKTIVFNDRECKEYDYEVHSLPVCTSCLQQRLWNYYSKNNSYPQTFHQLYESHHENTPLLSDAPCNLPKKYVCDGYSCWSSRY